MRLTTWLGHGRARRYLRSPSARTSSGGQLVGAERLSRTTNSCYAPDASLKTERSALTARQLTTARGEDRGRVDAPAAIGSKRWCFSIGNTRPAMAHWQVGRDVCVIGRARKTAVSILAHQGA